MSTFLPSRVIVLGLPAAGTGAPGLPPMPPPPVVAERPTLAPSWTLFDWTRDEYRPVMQVNVDGLPMYCNGHDHPWLSGPANGWADFDLGCDALGQGEHAANAASLQIVPNATGWLLPAQSARYYVTLRDPNNVRESAPQVLDITNPGPGNADVRVVWNGAGIAPPWVAVRIYRRFRNADTFRRVAEVSSTAGSPYLDQMPWATLEALGISYAYVQRYRLTRPPLFLGMVAFRGRVYGWDGTSGKLYYSQRTRVTDAEFVQDDFLGELDIGIEDGFGVVTASVEHQSVLMVFKGRAIYQLDGDDPDNFVVRRLVSERGCVGRFAVCPVRDYFAFLDQEGLLLWSPSGDPTVAGGYGTTFSPIQPIWTRMNQGAGDAASIIFDERTGAIVCSVALDQFPIASHEGYFNTEMGVWESFSPNCYSTSQGVLEDAGGGQHLMRGDDLGVLSERDAGAAEIAYDGDLSGILTSVNGVELVASGAAFGTGMDGAVSSRLDIRSSAGDVLDVNRVAAATPTSLTPLYAPPAAAVAGNVVVVGVIPFVAATPPYGMDRPENKFFGNSFLTFEQEAPGVTCVLESQIDADPWDLEDNDLDLNDARNIKIPLNEFGDNLGMRVSSREPGAAVRWIDFVIDYTFTGYQGTP